MCADNFAFTEGSGKTGAADDIGGVLYPRVKVTWGPDGTANDADTASGKPLPVQLRDSDGTDVALSAKLGSLTETAPTTDTASSGLNGRLQRIAQRITSLIALIPAALTGSGNFKVSLEESNATQAISAASLPLPTGAATSANQSTANTALAAIQTAIEILDNIVSGSEAQVDVVGALPSGTNTIGKVNVLPETTGGLSIFRSIDLDESEEEVKATAGQVYGMWVTNTATSTRFVKFYNATAANVSVGTTTPVITIGIPGNSSDDVSGLLASTHGIAFDTAITVAATTGVADNDTGAPGANEVIINIFYK